MPKQQHPSETVRAAIRGSGLTLAELARRAGINKATLSRFMAEETKLGLDSFERLAPLLGLHITKRKGGSPWHR